MKKIGKEQVRKARQTLAKYKEGKAVLDKRIVSNEQWWKLRHWGEIGYDKDDTRPMPASAWLFNSLANKHADAMDNIPEPAVLPREKSDEEVAKQFHAHFSRIAYTKGGEKCHLTFADTEYGPPHEPLLALLKERGLTPTIICESAGTQAEDAAELAKTYAAL